jgi:hypothetical protein
MTFANWRGHVANDLRCLRKVGPAAILQGWLQPWPYSRANALPIGNGEIVGVDENGSAGKNVVAQIDQVFV